MTRGSLHVRLERAGVVRKRAAGFSLLEVLVA